MKKGFTLIELQGVIVLLAILMLISIPIVLEQMKKSETEMNEIILDNISVAARDYYTSRPDEFRFINGYTFCVRIKDLIDNNFINQSVFENKIGGKINIYDYVETVVIDGKKDLSSDIVTSCTPSNTFTCGANFIDDRDGKVYRTIDLDGQCFFRDNLAYTTPACLGATWDATLPHDACRTQIYNSKTEVLYQWGSAMNGSIIAGDQGLCPTGWHIPTDSEVQDLELFLGMNAGVLNNTGWRGTEGADFMDPTGLNIYLLGSRASADGSLVNVDSIGTFWTSTQSATNAYKRHVWTGMPGVWRSADAQSIGNAVRCVR